MTPRFTRIAFRLPAIVILAAALAAIAIGGFSYFESASEVRRQATDKLVSLRESRHAALAQYFRSIEEDLELYSASAHVAAALEAFTAAFAGIGPETRDREERALRSVYSPEHRTGNADQLTSAGTPLTAQYFQLHNRFHTWFQFTHEVRGYYDLFLVSPSGDVVYTAFKEADFASNLVRGKWSGSGLAKAFASALDGGQAFADFKPYAPSDSAPAAFIARKIVRDGRTLGVLALQMPIDRINEVMQVTAGMGETGETYIVGPDYLMRSDSRFSETSTILKTSVATGTAKRAFAGESGIDVVDDYRGVPVLSAFQPFVFSGTTWAVMAEIDVAEVDTPIDTMRNSIAFIGIGLTLLVALGGVVLAGSITKPLAELSRSITEFRETRKPVDLSRFPGRDEIAEIARGFQSTAQEVADYISARVIAEQQLESQRARLNDILTNIRQGIVLFDKDQRIVAWNTHYPDILNIDEADLKSGMTLLDLTSRIAERGDYGEGDPAELARQRVEKLWAEEFRADASFGSDRSYDVHSNRTPDGGLVISYIDITERKKAEQQIEIQRAQLNDILTNIRQGIVLFDKDQRIVAWNTHYPDILNIDEADLKSGMTLYDVVHRVAECGDLGDGDPAELARNRVGNLWAEDHRADASFGDDRSYDVQSNRTPEGGLVISFIDITERKKAARQVEAQRKLLVGILTNVQQGVILFDEERRLTTFNPRSRDLLGLEEGALKRGMTLFELAFLVAKKGGYGEGDPTELARARVEKLWQGDVRTDVSFDDQRSIDVHANRTPDGGLLISYVDITDRKEAEEALKESEARFQTVLDNMPAAVYLRDTKGRYTLINKAYRDIYGVAGEEIFEKSLNDLLPAAQAKEYADQDREVIEQGRVVEFESELEVDDESRVLSIIKFPIRSVHGAIESVGGVDVDITERREAERQLKDAYDVISDSIQYASNIQRSLLPPEEFLAEDLADHFIIWEPRDVVGGDLYWYRRSQGGFVIALADCTGHGVPGAFMTMLSTGALDRALRDRPDGDPAQLLPLMNRSIKHFLGQNDDEGGSDDGLELGVCHIDTEAGKLVFSGARFSLFRVNGNGVEEIKGDKSGIGYRRVPPDQAFTNHEVALENGDTFYMTTDGLTDQIGGEKRRAPRRRRVGPEPADGRPEAAHRRCAKRVPGRRSPPRRRFGDRLPARTLGEGGSVIRDLRVRSSQPSHCRRLTDLAGSRDGEGIVWVPDPR